jgi:hypothetical protein
LALREAVVFAVPRNDRLFALVALIVEAHVLSRWVPRLVGVVGVCHEKERLIPYTCLLEQFCGDAKDPWSKPVLLALATLRIGQILAGPLAAGNDEVTSAHLFLGDR